MGDLKTNKYRITILQIDKLVDGEYKPWYRNGVEEDCTYADVVNTEFLLAQSNVEEIFIKAGVDNAVRAGFDMKPLLEFLAKSGGGDESPRRGR